MRDRTAIFGFAAALLLAPAALAQDGFQDLNAIIRSLAPKRDLPEHSGVREAAAPRSIDLEVPFALDSAELTEAARRQLDVLAEALRAPELTASRFLIAGHTDATGGAGYNKALSERRAAAVLGYLVARHAIAAERLLASGFGEERLKDPANPAAAVNRRVEVVALADRPAPAEPKSRTEKITY